MLTKRVRVPLSLPQDVLDRLDDYAKKKSITRNAAISLAITTVLDQETAIEYLPELLRAYTKERAKG